VALNITTREGFIILKSSQLNCRRQSGWCRWTAVF
jgi:hypothetical protein